MKQFFVGHIRMLECRRIAVEFLPIRLGDEVLHVLVQRRTWKRCEYLEKGAAAVKFDGVINRCSNAFDSIGEKTEYVESLGRNSFVPAVADDLALVLLGDRPAP